METAPSKVLMCPPLYFRVDYSINPWMDTQEDVNPFKALQQWNNLYNVIKSFGASIELLNPHPYFPDLVFTANGGVVRNNQVVLSNFKYPERQGEKDFFKEWFEYYGYQVHELPDDLSFEGCGDCIIVGDELLAGYGFRTDYRALELVSKTLGLKLNAHKLVDPNFYHLDTCLTILDKEKKIGFYYPPAFEDFNDSSYDLHPVSKEDALNFSCNSVVIGKNIIIPYGQEESEIVNYLVCNNYNVYQVGVSEFLKAGGACQCLVLGV